LESTEWERLPLIGDGRREPLATCWFCQKKLLVRREAPVGGIVEVTPYDYQYVLMRFNPDGT